MCITGVGIGERPECLRSYLVLVPALIFSPQVTAMAYWLFTIPFHLAASPDGRMLVSGGFSGSFQVYKLKTLRLLQQIETLASYIEHICFSHE